MPQLTALYERTVDRRLVGAGLFVVLDRLPSKLFDNLTDLVPSQGGWSSGWKGVTALATFGSWEMTLWLEAGAFAKRRDKSAAVTL